MITCLSCTAPLQCRSIRTPGQPPRRRRCAPGRNRCLAATRRLIQPTAYHFRPPVFDQAKHACNHNYMNTPQADAGAADDAAGTDNDTND